MLVSSQANIDNWDQIREDNLRRAGQLEGTPETNVAIVWLSYNVHGNESVSSEATMQTLWELADPNNSRTQAWLENTVVIMDPCINPDGRDRYANFFNQYKNKTTNPDLNSLEHNEPWPGGRANHYLFDLNRDWAWQTQQESQQRMRLYNIVLPHVHVDFHEQGINNPYYFAPAAQPYHEVITPWQREFQDMIGRNHAKYFDENNWLYFTKEVFDLLYPSYGDTYPTYNGAIGMTYEKGGSGRAGLGGLMNNGDTVTLKDRILHHHTTGLSTVEITSQNAPRVLQEFTTYHNNAKNNPPGTYKSFIIKSDNHPDKMRAVTEWLDSQGIQYGSSKTSKPIRGFSYRSGNQGNVSVGTGDIVVSMYQPKSNLVKVLFEPKTRLVDSLTYDITAWAIPYNYDLNAYATTERLNVTVSKYSADFTPMTVSGKPYAYVAPYQTFNDLKWMSQVLAKGVKARAAEKPFSLNGKSYAAGTLVFLRWDNEHIGDKFDNVIKAASDQFQKAVDPVTTGWVDQGKDFGSGFVNVIKTPSVALLSGPQTSSLSFGEIWHFFEQQIDYPLAVLHTDYVKNVDLSEYDVFIVPNGFYRLFDDNYRNEIRDWVRAGGRLILVENALRAFVDKDGFGLSRYLDDKEKKAAQDGTPTEEDLLQRYEDRNRNGVTNFIPGAIFKLQLDNSHPLGFGYPNHYFSIKRGSAKYAYLKNGWNVGVIRDKSALQSGFVGHEALDNMNKNLVFGVESMGSGEVVYMADNPLFRAFWYSGKMIFGNAVFMVGQ